jgi:hypothetical protein
MRRSKVAPASKIEAQFCAYLMQQKSSRNLGLFSRRRSVDFCVVDLCISIGVNGLAIPRSN